VAEQHLDDAHVDLLLEQVSCEAMAQRVHRDGLVDAGNGGGGVHSAVEHSRRDRVDWLAAREDPAAVDDLAAALGVAPPDAQAFEQQRRQHGVAVLVPLALINAQNHALRIDVARAQAADFTSAKPGAIRHRKCGLVLEAGR